MQHGPPRRRPARPAPDAPIDALLGRVEDITKGWALALVEQAPLDQMSSAVSRDLVAYGPRVCEAALKALASDAALSAFEPGGAAAGLVGRAAAGADVSSLVDALRAVLWSALRDELGVAADGEYVFALGERLALVCELAREAAGSVVEPSRPRAESTAARLAVESRDAGVAVVSEAGEGPLWIAALEDEIAHAEQTETPLSLLLVELDDADRVAAVEPRGEAAAAFGRFAQALRSALRRKDVLACETGTRAWIIARDTEPAGAQALGARIASAVRAAEPWRGAPLTVTVGVAVLGEDGRDCGSLVDAAEEARFAAAATGLGVVGAFRGGRPER